ncbi:MAG: hypothetical protein IJH63_00330 [Methanobrevibacter sp.]|nr:hypothetical protein [Methanosphaera sp.]MBR0369150.1 hypothetical protein [Methanobrevibacter sp.]
MVLFFPNEQLELYEYTEKESRDAFLGESEYSYDYITTVPCDFQPMTPKDSLQEYGKILEDTYKIYVSGEVKITDTMILKLKGQRETYKIIGSPSNYNHFLHHHKIVVQKQRKPKKLHK